MSSKNRVTANCDYVQGHLRGGYITLKLTDEELIEFKLLSKQEQLDWIIDVGVLEVDDFEVDDFEISDFEIEERKQ